MKKLIFGLVVFAALAFFTVPAIAAEPVNKVTFGGWAVTPDTATNRFDVLNAPIHFGGVGMFAGGAWRGEGSFMDKDFRLKAHLNVEDGTLIQVDPFIRIGGYADVWIDNVKLDKPLRWNLWLLTTPPDGVQTFDFVLYSIPGIGHKEWYIKGNDVLEGGQVKITE